MNDTFYDNMIHLGGDEVIGGCYAENPNITQFMKDNKLKPDALIMLTDGYMSSDVGNWAGVECPVLWCVIGNSRVTIPKGKVVRVEPD